MDDIGEYLNITQNKISRLNDFIALSLRRKRISKELQQVAEKAIAVRDELISAHECMQDEINKLVEDYENVMSEMRKKQMLVMQFIIKEKERNIKDAEEEEKKVQLVLSCSKAFKSGYGSAVKAETKSAMKLLGSNFAQFNLGHGHGSKTTPRIKISEYKDSPLVRKKIIPVPIQFTEFDVQITQQQFDKIPKYMCGRETLDQLNSFLQTVIIPCFNDKYQLIHKQRNILRNSNDLELWRMYNEQASYMPGKIFITPGDITRIMNKMLDKKAQNRLTMFRHLGLLQEQRVKQTVCYIWSYNGY